MAFLFWVQASGFSASTAFRVRFFFSFWFEMMHSVQRRGVEGSLPGSSRSRTVSFFPIHMTYASPMHITYESHYFYRSQIDSEKTIIACLHSVLERRSFHIATSPCPPYPPLDVCPSQRASGLDTASRQAERGPGRQRPPYSNAGVAGLLRSTPKKATFSLTATYSLSAYPNSLTICVLCIPLIRLISAAE